MSGNHVPALVALWDAAVARFGDQPALNTPDGWSASYRDVAAAAAAIRDDLRSHGVFPGDAVLLGMARGPVWLPALLGTWLAGGVAVPVPSDERASRRVLAAWTGARHRIVDAAQGSAWYARYDIEPHDQRGPQDAVCGGALTAAHAYAMATSGSTGEPKLALVTHRTSAAVVTGLVAAVGIEAGEHALHTAAFTFSSSIRQLFVPLLSGARVTVFTAERFAPQPLLEVTTQTRVTSLDLTPSHLVGVVGTLEANPGAPRPGMLRRLLVASEVLRPAVVARWRRLVGAGPDLVHLYGQTETGGAVSALRHADDDPPRPGQLPLALPFAPFTAYFDARADGTAEMLLAGLDRADGLLVDGRWDRSRYEARLGGAAGLYRTGDLFVGHPDGPLRFHGRTDTDVKILGVRVDTAALERQLSTIPGIEHVVVGAVPRAGGSTQLGVGYTASGEGPTEAQVASEAASRLSSMLPAPQVLRLDAVPLNRSGKLDRPAVLHALRVALTTHTGSRGDPVHELWRRHTSQLPTRVPAGADSSPGDLDFFAAGGDSLSMIALLADVARTLSVRVLPAPFHREPTLAGLRRLVAAAKEDRPDGQPPSTIPPPAGNRPAGGPARRPATAFHRGLWISERLAGVPSSPYWLPLDLEVPGALDPGRLTAAWRTVLTRFDALRLGFVGGDEGTLTLIPDLADPAHAELQTLPAPATPRLDGLGLMTDSRRLAHLAVGGGPGHTVLALRVHHAVADRPSLAMVAQELCRVYDGCGPSDAGGTVSFLAWLDTVDDLGAHAAAQRFWLESLPASATATVRAKPPRIERATAAARPRAAVGAAAGATRHGAWLWSFHRALAANRLAQSNLIGIDVDLRSPAAAGVVGPCVNALPVILPERSQQANGAAAATAAIAQVLSHAAVPVAAVVPADRRPTGDPRQPFFRYKLVYQAAAYPPLRIAGEPVRYLRRPTGITENTVTLFVRELDDRVDLDLAWDTNVVDRDTAVAVLAATAGRPDIPEERRP